MNFYYGNLVNGYFENLVTFSQEHFPILLSISSQHRQLKQNLVQQYFN